MRNKMAHRSKLNYLQNKIRENITDLTYELDFKPTIEQMMELKSLGYTSKIETYRIARALIYLMKRQEDERAKQNSGNH